MKGTRAAVLQEIEDWEMDGNDTSIFWLKGVTGCSKTAIAQTVAERSAADGRLGASFFCSRDFDDRRDVRLVCPTLAHQLAYNHPTTFRPALVQVIRSHPDIKSDRLEVQFHKIIVGPLQSIETPTTIVIDALDECRDRDPVSQFLSALARHLNELSNVKFFITGRPEDHIRSGFEILSLQTKILPLHDVDYAVINSDIKSYVKQDWGVSLTENDTASSVLGHQTKTSLQLQGNLLDFSSLLLSSSTLSTTPSRCPRMNSSCS
jgi:NACHT domain